MPRLWFLTSFPLTLLLYLLVFAAAGAAQGTPIPPGIRAADKAQQRADQTIEPPQPPAQKLNLGDVNKQADELLALAQQVHADTMQATQVLLAKDLKEKLKRMEKLSKRLREELTP
jgi:hypothetical protein